MSSVNETEGELQTDEIIDKRKSESSKRGRKYIHRKVIKILVLDKNEITKSEMGITMLNESSV